VHHLSYGSSERYGDRLWGVVGVTKFSQAHAAIIENNDEPLATWKHGEEVHGLSKFDLGDLAGLGIMTTPKAIKTYLASQFLSKSSRGSVQEIWTIFVEEWHGGTYRLELFEPDASVVRDGVESPASLFGEGLGLEWL
jgi:hypothetical protein